MKGVWIEKTGGTEVLQYRTDIPVPEPKEGEVLVKNEFIGINYIDTLVFSPRASFFCLDSHSHSLTLFPKASVAK